MENVLWVGLGGFVGANVRYGLTLWISQFAAREGWTFPLATLVINFSGSFLLAFFITLFSDRLSPQVRLLVATGFFGAYTTFSTFAVESVALWQNGDRLGAVGNVLLTNGLCLAGVILGIIIANRS